MKIPYRFLVPFVSQVQETPMDEEQDIDETEQVMRVPEGIETGQFVERRRQSDDVSAEPTSSQSERDGHEDHHHNPGHTFCSG